MQLLVVLPVCEKDFELATLNLELCRKLDGKLQFDCMVVHEKGYNASKIVEDAKKTFGNVFEYVYDDWKGDKNWPTPQNYAWQSVARKINEDPNLRQSFTGWLWWEQDAAPLRSNWLHTIDKLHKKARQPFSGNAQGDENTPFYMVGVGVWPTNTLEYLTNSGALWVQKSPFDRIAGPEVKGKFNNISDIIIHRRKKQGGGEGFTFNERTFNNLIKINRKAALFHGCTDGTIQKILLGHEIKQIAPSKQVTIRQTLARFRYGEGQYSSEIEKLPYKFFFKTKIPKIFHCVERHKINDEITKQRVDWAFDSWCVHYESDTMIPRHLWDYPRDSSCFGDNRKLPFLKDVLALGLQGAQDTDIILLTNDDTVLHNRCHEAVLDNLKKVDAISSFRLNYTELNKPSLDIAPHEARKIYKKDFGRDLFAMRKSWIMQIWNSIPDFLLGELEWDLVLSALIRKYYNAKLSRDSIADRQPECEMELGYVFHHDHPKKWTFEEHRISKAKEHNRMISQSWYSDHSLHHLISYFGA